MGLFSLQPPQAKRIPDPTDGRADFASHDEDAALALSDPRLPIEIVSQARAFGSACAHVHRMPTDRGIEWWLMDANGELLDAVSFK